MIISQPWAGRTSTHEHFTWKDGVYYLSVTSDGKTGKEWCEESFRNFYSEDDKSPIIQGCAERIIESEDFKPTRGKKYEIAILDGWNIDKAEWCTVENIRQEAKERGWREATPEVACLLRKSLSDEDLSYMRANCVVVMHDPLPNFSSENGQYILTLFPGKLIEGRFGSRLIRPSLDTIFFESEKRKISRANGFAFIVSEEDNKNQNFEKET